MIALSRRVKEGVAHDATPLFVHSFGLTLPGDPIVKNGSRLIQPFARLNVRSRAKKADGGGPETRPEVHQQLVSPFRV